MDINALFGLLGGLLIAGSFIPYIRDIIAKKAEPHAYTWFIWSVTQVVAALAIFKGDGGLFATVSIAVGALLSFYIFGVSLKRGLKNINNFDTATLFFALIAIVFWWGLDHPEWAVITISIVDLLGFVPTFRKTWKEPLTESLTAWSLFIIGNIAVLLSLTEYNILTSLYIVTMIFASSLLLVIIAIRTNR